MKGAHFLALFGLIFFTSLLVDARIPSFTTQLNKIVRNLESSYRKNHVKLPPEMWFDQRIDHFNGQDSRTWKQRYYINDTFWDGTGPIFFQIGGEGAISPAYVVSLQMAEYGAQYGALLLALEHRFYGASQPFDSLSTDGLRYLSSQQALADASVFLEAIKKQFNAEENPVISFGCSYPGNLAAWFRLKFPTSTIASVASSSPVQATLDFFQYLDVVDKSLSYYTGVECDKAIQQATSTIQSLLTTSTGRAKLMAMFSLCEPLVTDKDVSTFMSNLMGNFMGVVQYNDERGNPIDAKYLCGIMLDSSDPLAAYINVSNLFLRAQGANCMDVSYQNMLESLWNLTASPDNSGARQWTYQTCAEFGYFQTTDSPSTLQPFGNLVPLSYYTQLCTEAFGVQFNTDKRINETNVYYGGSNLGKYGPTNIMFVNGNIDPWHALSVVDSPSVSVPTLLINGTAHCANVLPSRPDDIPSLVAARKQISIQIGSWLSTQKKPQKKKKILKTIINN